MRIIRRSDRGEPVRDVQHRLVALGFAIEADELDGGGFGPSTEAAVGAFQERRGLPVDGVVGPDTWSQLVEAGFRLGDRTLYFRYPAFRGDDVAALQRRLNALGFDAGKEDGLFGERTDHAVREFQRNVGELDDGIVGPETVAAFERLRPPLEAPSRAMVREEEAVLTMRSSLAGSAVAIDPGRGPSDPGPIGPTGATEAELTALLGADLAAELGARGAEAVLLRQGKVDPSAPERARHANAAAAAVCISLRLGGGAGATCAYFGTPATHSPAGMRLAELILVQLGDVEGVRIAGGTRPLAVAILRETRMPAVLVEPCEATEDCLGDPAFRSAVARAIADGVERFLGAN